MSQSVQNPSTDYIFQITKAVSEKEETDPLDIPPLNDYINTDALTNLLNSGNENLHIQFSFHGYEIEARGNGSISVEKAPSTRVNGQEGS